MPDITLCNPTQGCRLKQGCYRFRAIPDKLQSYSDFSNEPKAECFLKIFDSDKLRIVNGE